MKMRIFAIVLMLALLLTACGSDPAQNTTVAPGTQGTTTPTTNVNPTTANPTTAIKPTEGEEELVDLFGSLYPNKEGEIPSKSQFQEIVKAMAQQSTRISEITYTFTEGRASMEVLAGRYDEYYEMEAPEESPLQLIYDQNEFYNYVLYLPEGYDPADTEKQWPVIFFMHGIGEIGSDLNELLPYGPLRYVNKGGKLDAIIIAPQCPDGSHWADHDVEEEKLVQFVPQMLEQYNIDSSRVYLTGLSMGGRGTWKLALAMPDTFAAIVVVCGRTNTYDFDKIKDMPIWMFHGVEDDTVGFYNIPAIMTKLAQHEHEYYKLTVLPHGSHMIWGTVYDRPEVYDWLMSQTLSTDTAE